MFSMSKLAHPDGRRRPNLMKKKSRFETRRRLVIIITTLLVVVAGALLALYLLGGQKADPDQISKPTEKVEPVRYYSPLTGRETTQKKTAAPALAVMIENSPEARPQSGLTDAGVVFEAIAEGGITRFIALYQEAEPELIGPVRSARPYYLEWAAAFDPAVAHVGGSDDALIMLRSGSYGVDLDQYFNDSAYWRTKDRSAPHNVYTDYAHLNKLADAKGKTSSKFTGWERQEGKPYECPKCADDMKCAVCEAPVKYIDLAISSGFAVHYDYDETSNTYHRSIGGKKHLSRTLDKTDVQIAPDVVIAIRVSQTVVDSSGHNKTATTGSGEAFVFQDGQVIKGTWSKTGASSQIQFLDKEGSGIKLNRGQVWITAVPSGRAITWQET